MTCSILPNKKLDMLGIIRVMILLSLGAQAHAKEVPSLHHSDLDNTALWKFNFFGIIPRTSLSPFLPLRTQPRSIVKWGERDKLDEDIDTSVDGFKPKPRPSRSRSVLERPENAQRAPQNALEVKRYPRQWRSERKSSDRFDGKFDRSVDKRDDPNRINMRVLESKGYLHLYGLAPVLNALSAAKRNFSPDFSVDVAVAEKNRAEPRLFVQETTPSSSESSRSGSKVRVEKAIKSLAASLSIPTTYLDKGILNSLSGNRPHQGYVLRARELDIPITPESQIFSADGPDLWIALDSVMDPQNLGAILRSVLFLGSSKLGVLICTKNSAPLSPVVSAASAGALEIQDIVSVNKLFQALEYAKAAGYTVIGSKIGQGSFPIGSEPSSSKTVLVFGNEGTGLRTLVARACDFFVAVPGGTNEGVAGVDSLNVAVTAGILLQHFVTKSKQLESGGSSGAGDD